MPALFMSRSEGDSPLESFVAKMFMMKMSCLARIAGTLIVLISGSFSTLFLHFIQELYKSLGCKYWKVVYLG